MNIIESGMYFGEFPDKQCYVIENSTVHKQVGENVKSVEFVYYSNKDLIFLEAKSSCPKPDSNNNTDLEKSKK